jgi:hypothetical protein
MPAASSFDPPLRARFEPAAAGCDKTHMSHPHGRTIALVGALLVALAAAMPAFADTPPRFSQHPVTGVHDGALAKPKIDARKQPELLRAWREVEKPQVNAAGRYVLLKEFCGSACAHGHLLDARTGRVIRLPFTISGWRETEDNFEPIVTRANSRLIVLRGARNEDGINGVHYYTIETNGSLKHLRSDDTDGNFEKALVVD